MDTLLKGVRDYGLEAVLAIGIFSLLLIVLNRADALTTKIINQQAEERCIWAKQQEAYIMRLKQIDESMAQTAANQLSFKQSVDIAHQYQRDEHKSICESNGMINKSLMQIEVALGRINDYLKDRVGHKSPVNI